MRNFKFLVLPFIFLIFISCKSSQKIKPAEKTVLFTIDNSPTFTDEFIYAYQKSNKNKGEIEPVDDYLDLYIDFKLKVAAAKSEGLDTTQSYQNELNGYLEEIKKPYLTTEKVNKKLVKEAYDRLQQEINASHILIKAKEDAKPSDTLKAYEKISKIRDKYKAGENFEALARTYSEDPSAQSNNGLLGWFTAFQMVYPFESAAFQTAVGKISPIIRTQFGYHLIKVNDTRETLGRVKIAHIMKRFPSQATTEDSLETEKEIQAIYKKLNEGENWFTIATNESEDLNTKDKGGSLPWFGAGNLPSSLETVAFELEGKGDISNPVQSPFGWHILKLEDKRGVGSLQSMEESLSRRVQRDQRSDLKDAEVIKRLKDENNFRKNTEAYKLLKSKENFNTDNFKKKELEMVLFNIADKNILIQEFLNEKPTTENLASKLEEFEKSKLISYEENNLENKYPEYRLLRQEYKDGLLLFEIMSQKVWSKVGKDSLAIENFYQENKNDYKSKLKMKVARIVFSDTSTIKPFKKPINNTYFPLTEEQEYNQNKDLNQQFKFTSNNKDTVFISLKLPKNINHEDSSRLITKLNESFGNMEVAKFIYSDENKIYLQLLSKANNLLVENIESISAASIENIEINDAAKSVNKDVGGYVKKVTKEGMIELIYSLEKYPPKQKSFEEAKAQIMEDYQNYLEQEWLSKLKNQHKVSVNKNELNKIKAEIEE